jgi:hypothetical protein
MRFELPILAEENPVLVSSAGTEDSMLAIIGAGVEVRKNISWRNII